MGRVMSANPVAECALISEIFTNFMLLRLTLVDLSSKSLTIVAKSMISMSQARDLCTAEQFNVDECGTAE